MDYIIWFSKEHKTYQLDREVNRNVFEGDRSAQYLRILYRFTENQSSEAKRVYQKLAAGSIGMFA